MEEKLGVATEVMRFDFSEKSVEKIIRSVIYLKITDGMRNGSAHSTHRMIWGRHPPRSLQIRPRDGPRRSLTTTQSEARSQPRDEQRQSQSMTRKAVEIPSVRSLPADDPKDDSDLHPIIKESIAKAPKDDFPPIVMGLTVQGSSAEDPKGKPRPTMTESTAQSPPEDLKDNLYLITTESTVQTPSEDLKDDLRPIITKLTTVFGDIKKYKRLLGCRDDEAQRLLDLFQTVRVVFFSHLCPVRILNIISPFSYCIGQGQNPVSGAL